jgi:hypothetical protein
MYLSSMISVAQTSFVNHLSTLVPKGGTESGAEFSTAPDFIFDYFFNLHWSG